MSRPEPNPYVGPGAFQPDHEPLFFGREREKKRLMAAIDTSRVVLFYAPSGAGKTSLINAAILPELKRRNDRVLPVARVGGEVPAASAPVSVSEPTNVYVWNVLSHLSSAAADSVEETGSASLAEALKARLDDEDSPAILILDQFEEILTTHPRQRDQREDFFRQLRRALAENPLLSVVLVLREDHLAALEHFLPLLPSRLRGTFRMDRLRHKEAIEAVREPAKVAGRPFAEGVAERLVDNLSLERVAGEPQPVAGEFVEPVQLQVVCYQLWESLRERPGGQITDDDLAHGGNVDQALEAFCERVVKRVARRESIPERRVLRWLNATLIAPTGIRAQASRGPEATAGLPNRVVDRLVDEHLIRSERVRGGVWYELVHDRFIEPVSSVEHRRRAARRTAIFRLAAAALIIAALLAGLFLRWRSVAAQSRIVAREQANEALAAVSSDPGPALGLAVEAANQLSLRQLAGLPEVENALRQAFYAARLRPLSSPSFPTGESLSALATGLGESGLAAGYASGRVAFAASGASAAIEFSAHRGLVSDLAIAPNGRLATLGRDGRVAVWEPAVADDPLLMRELVLGLSDIVALSRDGSRLAVTLADHRVGLWEVGAGEQVGVLVGPRAPVFALAFSPDGRRLAAGSDIVSGESSGGGPPRQEGTGIAEVWIWDVETARTLRSFEHPGPVLAVTFAPDGRRLASLDGIGAVHVWDIETGEETDRFRALAQPAEAHPPEPIFDITFGPRGEHLVAVTQSGAAWLFDIAASHGFLIGTLGTGNGAGSGEGMETTALAADGTRLATAGYSAEPRLWEISFAEVPVLRGHQGPLLTVAFSPDGRWLAAAGEEGRVSIWETPDPKDSPAFPSPPEASSFEAHQGRIDALSFSPTQELLATAGGDGTARLWNARDRTLLDSREHEGLATAVAFAGEGDRWASAGRDGRIRIGSAGDEEGRSLILEHGSTVSALAWEPRGSLLVSAGADGGMRIWDADSGREIADPTGHGELVKAVCFDPGGRLVASGSLDGTAKLWRADTGAELFSLAGHQDGTVNDLAFSPDGRRLATGGSDGKVVIWDAESGARLFDLPGPRSAVQSLAFEPRGRYLAVAREDGTVRLEIWDRELLLARAQENLAIADAGVER